MIKVIVLLSFLCTCANGMQQSRAAAKCATEELNKRLLAAYTPWYQTLHYESQLRKQSTIAHEKGMLLFIEHLIQVGADPHSASLIRVHGIKEHYIKGKTALEMATDLNFYEITALLKAIPKHKEKIE